MPKPPKRGGALGVTNRSPSKCPLTAPCQRGADSEQPTPQAAVTTTASPNKASFKIDRLGRFASGMTWGLPQSATG